MFGGADGQVFGDTWMWDGANWHNAPAVTSPPARTDAAMAYDAARGRLVLFGGHDATQSFSGTWEWDGTTWTQVATATSPPARSGHSMVYHAAAQRVLCFGGDGGPAGLADTWSYDGTTWTQLSPIASPVARSGHSLVYDSQRQRSVLFGGESAVHGALADTWEWDGTTWLPVVSPTYPSARSGHAMAFDSVRGTTILFGGDDGQNLADTWQWDGSSWQQTTATGNPVARRDHAIAYDSVRGRTVMFGGVDNAALMDTWLTEVNPGVYGTGCGNPALVFSPNTSAHLGGIAMATIHNAPTQLAAVTLGASNEFFGPFPLPFPLVGIGMPGCELLHSADITGLLAMPAGGTTLTYGLSIPGPASLIGSHIYAQAFALAPGANSAQLIISNGIDWTVTCAPGGPEQIVEDFTTSNKQDPLTSGGEWGGAGGAGARPGLVGGDGRHGSFDATLGQPVGSDTYVWNTDNFVIPGSSSLTGLQYTVTNGQFFFTDMVVPAGTTIRFIGSVPPVIRVRGQVDIQGTIEVNGADAPGQIATGAPSGSSQTGQKVSTFDARASLTGQPGSFGGVGGGRGGAGGDRCFNNGPIIVGGLNLTDGQPGESVQVGAGHAYAASAQASGGAGSLLTPVTGIWAFPTPLLQGVWCSYFSPGGAGGGFASAGAPCGTPNYIGNASIGAPATTAPVSGGALFSVMPFPPASPPPNYTSLEHFTVGGSGGGGGGSHGYGIVGIGNPPTRYLSGHGGTGGGGTAAIRSGGNLGIASGGLLSARGGDGVLVSGTPPSGSPANSLGVSSPGGAGSGGSFLLQSGQSVAVAGEINARGGIGSRVGELAIAQLRIESQAGNGADGFFRLEAPAGGVSFAGTSTPVFAANEQSGDLVDRDDRSGDSSLWYATGLVSPAIWSHYELDVDIDGDGVVDVTYTDTGAAGTQLAAEPGGPVTLPLTIQFQGATLDQSGQPTSPAALGPWRDGIGGGAGPGISLDQVNGYRFMLTFNRAMFPDLVVKQLRVFYSPC